MERIGSEIRLRGCLTLSYHIFPTLSYYLCHSVILWYGGMRCTKAELPKNKGRSSFIRGIDVNEDPKNGKVKAQAQAFL